MSADPVWLDSCLCPPALCLQDPPSAESPGLERAERDLGMGQWSAGTEPHRGAGLWLIAGQVVCGSGCATLVAEMGPALALLRLPAVLPGALQTEELWLG